MTGTDSNMYCWGNGSDDRAGKILNSANTVTQYENFTDNSREWTSSWTSYMQGPNEGLDYVYRALYNSWRSEYLTSGSSFEISPGDLVSFKMKGRYHGNNGAYTNEFVRISADGQALSTIYSNSTTSGSSLSAWQDVAFVVPDSYTCLLYTSPSPRD